MSPQVCQGHLHTSRFALATIKQLGQMHKNVNNDHACGQETRQMLSTQMKTVLAFTILLKIRFCPQVTSDRFIIE